MSSFNPSIMYTERDKTAWAREFQTSSMKLCSNLLSDDGVDLVSVNARTDGMRYQSHSVQNNKDMVAHDRSVCVFNSARCTFQSRTQTEHFRMS